MIIWIRNYSRLLFDSEAANEADAECYNLSNNRHQEDKKSYGGFRFKVSYKEILSYQLRLITEALSIKTKLEGQDKLGNFV